MKEQEESYAWSALLSSDIKLELLHLFRTNPKLTFGIEEIAKLIGRAKEETETKLGELLGMGVIRSISDTEVFCLDEDKDREYRTQMVHDLLKGCDWTVRNHCKRVC